MGLLTVGYWHTTYWTGDYWSDDYWQEYSTVSDLKMYADIYINNEVMNIAVNDERMHVNVDNERSILVI